MLVVLLVDKTVKAPVEAVVAPIVVPLIVPPVTATALAFWVDIVPRPLTCVFAMAIGVFVALVI